ncbi:MAG: helix-turn-helix domain-containing protein, partial [Myxococcota bacterium]
RLGVPAGAGAVIASWCTGAFLVAAAGLLDGRRATTHWAAAHELRARFPSVEVVADALIVDEGAVITSGGATTVYLLLHHLIHENLGPATAHRVAQGCLVDVGRPPQTAYDDGRRRDEPVDRSVGAVQAYIRAHLGDRLPLATLAKRGGMSTRSLTRRFGAAAGMTPAAFIQGERVRAAQHHLVQSDASFDAITRRVGYADPRAFRRLFRKIAGVSPSEYRRLFRHPRAG